MCCYCVCPGYGSITPMNGFAGLACLLLNIFLPGVGTMVNGCCGQHCCGGIIWGILQILTIPFLGFGWIWSICYGCEIYRRSGDTSGNVHVHHHYHKQDY